MPIGAPVVVDVTDRVDRPDLTEIPSADDAIDDDVGGRAAEVDHRLPVGPAPDMSATPGDTPAFISTRHGWPGPRGEPTEREDDRSVPGMGSKKALRRRGSNGNPLEGLSQ